MQPQKKISTILVYVSKGDQLVVVGMGTAMLIAYVLFFNRFNSTQLFVSI